jgi:hypothetical protein
MYKTLRIALSGAVMLASASATLAGDKDDAAGRVHNEGLYDGLYLEEHGSSWPPNFKVVRPAPQPGERVRPPASAEKGENGSFTQPLSPNHW